MLRYIICFFACLPICAKSQTISFEAEAKFSKREIETELAKYPVGLLRNYLYEIKVVEDDRMCGRSEAYSNRIVLSSNCEIFRTAIHHEISSVLLRQYDFKVKEVIDIMYGEFLKLNGDFKYDHNTNMHHIEEGSKTSEHFYNYKYAQSDFENDFNIIAQELFVNGDRTISYMYDHKDKPVSNKIQLVIDFYKKLDSRFTIEYFKTQKILN
jgi:hypothetical protein